MPPEPPARSGPTARRRPAPRSPCVTEEQLRGVELFTGLSSEQYAWLLDAGTALALADGEILFHDAEPARWFCVLVSGRLVISKVVDGREEVLTRHSAPRDPADPDRGKPSAAHGFTGEMPLLVEGAYVATATADGPTLLLRYDREAFMEMLVRCPEVARVLVPVLAWRIHASETQAAQRSRLDALGTLAAGLAHELNNPAAAVSRATTELGAALPDLESRARLWGAVATGSEAERLAAARAEVLSLDRSRAHRDPLAVAEAEDDLADWLAEHGLPDAVGLAEILAERGLDPGWPARLTSGMSADVRTAALSYLESSLGAAGMVAEAGEAGARVSGIIATVRDYTNLDRAPEQEVDLERGLESTLGIMRGRLSGVSVERDYAPDLPRVRGYPTELNQVWTNLVDNAVDAMADAARTGGRAPRLRVSTAAEGTCVIVRIADNGGGVPEEALPRLFDPFFTTKDVGRGTGLGLHLSHRIVTRRHNGTLTVETSPEGSVFAVRLPTGR
ncbi:ATP-binding protein [Nocardiopsis ganjiahuensis]|uniref:ATP-binding protein n=1 Tax=Nocardiopsis ganjiahuensis TaxID=239984 RepID=UPI000344BE8E|nr:ATP-binding protein [Nocardiopsis ganjiahuensis]